MHSNWKDIFESRDQKLIGLYLKFALDVVGGLSSQSKNTEQLRYVLWGLIKGNLLIAPNPKSVVKTAHSSELIDLQFGNLDTRQPPI